MIKSKDKNKIYYDKKAKTIKYSIGDKAYLKIEQFTKSKKLSSQYKGPYEIVKILPPSNVMIKQNRKQTIVHVDRLKLAHDSR